MGLLYLFTVPDPQFYIKAVTQVQHIQSYVFYSSVTKTCNHLGPHNTMKHTQLLDLSSLRMTLYGRNMSLSQNTLFLYINKLLCYRLTCCVYMS